MTPLYATLLADQLEDLPLQVREFHLNTANDRWTGVCEVRHGYGLLPRMARIILGLPQEGVGVPVSVTLERQDGTEVWTRRFGSATLRTRQELGRDGLLKERFGLISVEMDLVLRENRLYLEPKRWAFAGIPLPRALLPGGQSFETQEGQYFAFDVEYRLPFIGLIAAYKGTLLPTKENAPIKVEASLD